MPNDGEFFVTPDPDLHYLEPYSLRGNRNSEQAQLTNTSTEPLSGCKDGYGFTPAYNDSTSVSGLWVSDKSNELWRGHVPDAQGGGGDTSFANDLRLFVPISGGSNYENIIFYDEPIFTYIPNIPNPIWKIEGQSIIKFPTIPYLDINFSLTGCLKQLSKKKACWLR